jgi:hypothetical protein
MSTNRIVSAISRRRLNHLALATAFTAMLGVYSGCNMGGPSGPVTVPLEFRPGHAEALSGSLNAQDVKIHVAAATDKRENKDEIGSNVEKATPVPVYSSGKSPAEFVQDVLELELKTFGADLVEAPDAADRIIEMDLNRFFVEESKNYRARCGRACR